MSREGETRRDTKCYSRTNIISIEKSSQQDHLKRLHHATENHEQGSNNRHHVVDEEGLFTAKSEEIFSTVGLNLLVLLG